MEIRIIESGIVTEIDDSSEMIRNACDVEYNKEDEIYEMTQENFDWWVEVLGKMEIVDNTKCYIERNYFELWQEIRERFENEVDYNEIGDIAGSEMEIIDEETETYLIEKFNNCIFITETGYRLNSKEYIDMLIREYNDSSSESNGLIEAFDDDLETVAEEYDFDFHGKLVLVSSDRNDEFTEEFEDFKTAINWVEKYDLNYNRLFIATVDENGEYKDVYYEKEA